MTKFQKPANTKVVPKDELSTTEQRVAPVAAGRASTRRHRQWSAAGQKSSDGYEILTPTTSHKT